MAYEFRLTQHVSQPREAVFYAFTKGSMLSNWWCDWAFVPPFGMRVLYMYWQTGFQAMGKFEEFEEPERLAFTWVDGDSPACNATVTLSESNGGTDVELLFTNITNENQAEQLEKHWRLGLENLASVLETGIDLRVARKPMLGVYLGELVTAQNADRYGTPHGIIIEGTLPGLSAESAGLKSGDVLVEAAGQRLADYSDLTGILAGRTVGDVVDVTYMRDGERHTAAMELKPQQIVEVPRDPNELADRLAALYAQAREALNDVLDGVTEEQANAIVAPEEWTIRQIVAHLIAAERDEQTSISLVMDGSNDVFNYNNNSLVRIEPLIRSYPTLPELVAAVARTQDETVEAVRRLPPEFVERRGAYDQLGRVLLFDAESHLGEHIEQIEKAKAALLQREGGAG